MQKLPYKIIVIAGATATGKSDLADQVAHAIDAEIINADIGSFYTPLTIGTAKPDFQNSNVAHHLFNIFHTPMSFSFVKYREEVFRLVQQIHERKKHVIIVGGSTMYIKSLFFKQPDYDTSSVCFDVKTINQDNAWDQLQAIDPVRALSIHRNDHYRIMQALTIYYKTNQKPSLFQPVFEPICHDVHFIHVVQERGLLYTRIDQRVTQMFEQGLIQEVFTLIKESKAWASFLIEKKIIGYDDVVKFLQLPEFDQNALDDTIALIQKKSRNYAKRQQLFFKTLSEQLKSMNNQNDFCARIDELNLTLCDVGLYIKGLSEQILHNSIKR